jgi:acetolactate synthase-1/2/3 large subunit
MGLDAFPHNHAAFSGMLGTYGNRYANLSVANADFLMALGTRLDTRQTGTKPASFARMAKVVYVDIDAHELKNNRIKADLLINSDLKEFLAALNRRIAHYRKDKISRWNKAVGQYKKRYPSYKEPVKDSIKPNFFMHKLSEFLPEDAIICADVGQNQMWAAQSLEINKPQRFLTQGGMGAMGSSLPMAIGASFAHPDKIVAVIVGDGGFQLNIQELETVYHHKLPIKIILLNNHCYGMVRQFQEQYFNSKFQSTIIGYSCPDFQNVVSAYKIAVNKIRACAEITGALKGLFKNRLPMFLEVNIEPANQVMPKLAVNKPIEEQEPALSADELKSNMFIEILPRG